MGGNKNVVVRRVSKKKDVCSVLDELIERQKSELKTLTYLERLMLFSATAGSVSLVTVVGLHVAGRI